MKSIPYLLFAVLLLAGNALSGQTGKKYDIFSYQAPKGFSLQKLDAALFYKKTERNNYCQIFLYPATVSKGSVESDFEANWNSFAKNSEQGVVDPETKDIDSTNGWQVVLGAARGSFSNQPFVITLTTFTKGDVSFYTASVFTDKKYMLPVQEFIGSIQPEISLYASRQTPPPQEEKPVNQSTGATGNTTITKSTTRFDDGWMGYPANDYVKLTKEKTEVRLIYTNIALDNARPNTIDAPEYYWMQYVSPYYNITQTEKWSGVEYPVIYFMQGSGTELATGKPCHIALKIVYINGARPILVITPDQHQYQQQYPHPNSIDRMLNYNKFALSKTDITGKWTGGSGAGLQYYNAYTGDYAGMSTISTSDDFQFKSDGTYTSAFRSASTNFGSTRFSAVDYKGKYSITDWTISAGNRHEGKTTLFRAQLIAVKNGFLLYMEDIEYPAMNYTLIKIK